MDAKGKFFIVLYILTSMPFQSLKAEEANILSNNPQNDKHDIKNVIAYQEEGKFCGWPANEGIWSWGDEILVGFEIASFTQNERGHSIDRNSPKNIYFARSTDAGQTWQVEKPREIAPPAYLEDPNRYKSGDIEFKTLDHKIDFRHPDFAMKLRGQDYYYSYDRGRHWNGPFLLPDFGQKLIMSRTDYVVLDKHDCLIFSTASFGDGNYGKSFAARTTDGGLNWQFVGWITDDFPPRDYKKFSFSIMPSTVETQSGRLMTALRQRFEGGQWLDVYTSDDTGKSWTHLSKVVDNVNNPPSLLHLKDGRLCIVYCFRAGPYGLRAKVSEDMGHTWSDEIVLRDDGLSWDIGYVRSVQVTDGRVLSVYYYHTAQNPQQHIAATLWQP